MSQLVKSSMYVELSLNLLLREKKTGFRKEYFEIPWASLRAMVEPSMAERSVIKHRDYFTNGRIITSSAINITETEVLTADGQQIPYDFLVIATGHPYPVPKSRTERLDQCRAGKNILKLSCNLYIVCYSECVKVRVLNICIFMRAALPGRISGSTIAYKPDASTTLTDSYHMRRTTVSSSI